MSVHFHNSQRALPVSKKQVSALLQALLKSEAPSYKEVALYLVSSKAIAKLHDEFFNDPTPTDCITFPLDEKHLGELFVCPEVAIEYAKKHRLDPYEELTLYIVHGFLHCLGFDDLTPVDRRAMRKKEKSCMSFLKTHDLILRRP